MVESFLEVNFFSVALAMVVNVGIVSGVVRKKFLRVLSVLLSTLELSCSGADQAGIRVK